MTHDSCLGVEYLHRMQAAWHLHKRSIQEIALELLGLQRGAHDYQLQILALLQHLSHTSPSVAVLLALHFRFTICVNAWYR